MKKGDIILISLICLNIVFACFWMESKPRKPIFHATCVRDGQTVEIDAISLVHINIYRIEMADEYGGVQVYDPNLCEITKIEQ